MPGKQVMDWGKYHALRRRKLPKGLAARIANAQAKGKKKRKRKR